jgi:hypothetical protein
MYLAIIFLGCFNGLMLLPLILRWIGPGEDEVAKKRMEVQQKLSMKENSKMR